MKEGLSKISMQFFSNLFMTDFSEEFFRLSLSKTKISEERVDWVALSLREAVNNAIIHGNKNNPEKKVEVEIEFLDDEIYIRVWDEGDGFNPDSLPDPTKDENLLQPHGRGIFLIKQFVNKVEFISRNSGFGIELMIDLRK